MEWPSPLTRLFFLLRLEFIDPLGRVNLLACALYWAFVYWVDARMQADIERAKLVWNLTLSHAELVTWLERRDSLIATYILLFLALLLVSLVLLAAGSKRSVYRQAKK